MWTSFVLMARKGLFLIFGGDRVIHHVFLRLPNSTCNFLLEPSPRRQAGASLRLCEHLGAEAFAGLHHRPEDPGQLVGQRYRH